MKFNERKLQILMLINQRVEIPNYVVYKTLDMPRMKSNWFLTDYVRNHYLERRKINGVYHFKCTPKGIDTLQRLKILHDQGLELKLKRKDSKVRYSGIALKSLYTTKRDERWKFRNTVS